MASIAHGKLTLLQSFFICYPLKLTEAIRVTNTCANPEVAPEINFFHTQLFTAEARSTV